jgi:hypothetical protein
LRVCFLSAHDEVAPYVGLAARMGREMPSSPAAARNGAFLNDLLTEAGLSVDDTWRVIYAVFTYTWGHVLMGDATLAAVGGSRGADDREQFVWGLDHLLDAFRAAVTRT